MAIVVKRQSESLEYDWSAPKWSRTIRPKSTTVASSRVEDINGSINLSPELIHYRYTKTKLELSISQLIFATAMS